MTRPRLLGSLLASMAALLPALVLSAGLIFPATAAGQTSRHPSVSGEYVLRLSAWSSPSYSSDSLFSLALPRSGSYPGSCTASAPDQFPDPACQQANDLHRLVMFLIPAVSLLLLVTTAALVVAVVPGRR